MTYNFTEEYDIYCNLVRDTLGVEASLAASRMGCKVLACDYQH